MPAGLAAPILSRAIATHAWTFAGSGCFKIEALRPPVFLIHDNPVVRGEASDVPLCHWHAAVFERLFRRLVSRRTTVAETACCAQGAPACRFALRLR
jgi:divinyl protochlorophyllide a 8-vinyl-reductase